MSSHVLLFDKTVDHSFSVGMRWSIGGDFVKPKYKGYLSGKIVDVDHCNGTITIESDDPENTTQQFRWIECVHPTLGEFSVPMWGECDKLEQQDHDAEIKRLARTFLGMDNKGSDTIGTTGEAEDPGIPRGDKKAQMAMCDGDKMQFVDDVYRKLFKNKKDPLRSQNSGYKEKIASIIISEGLSAAYSLLKELPHQTELNDVEDVLWFYLNAPVQRAKAVEEEDDEDFDDG